MKNFIFIFFLHLIPFTLFSQKVTVQVIKGENAAKSDWQVLDEKYNFGYYIILGIIRGVV